MFLSVGGRIARRFPDPVMEADLLPGVALDQGFSECYGTIIPGLDLMGN